MNAHERAAVRAHRELEVRAAARGRNIVYAEGEAQQRPALLGGCAEELEQPAKVVCQCRVATALRVKVQGVRARAARKQVLGARVSAAQARVVERRRVKGVALVHGHAEVLGEEAQRRDVAARRGREDRLVADGRRRDAVGPFEGLRQRQLIIEVVAFNERRRGRGRGARGGERQPGRQRRSNTGVTPRP